MLQTPTSALTFINLVKTEIDKWMNEWMNEWTKKQKQRVEVQYNLIYLKIYVIIISSLVHGQSWILIQKLQYEIPFLNGN